MKLNKFWLMAIAVLGFTACQKVDDLPLYKNGVAPVLSSSTTAVAPPASDSLKPIITFSWTDPAYATDTARVKYTIEIDSAGRNFSKAVTKVLIGTKSTTFLAKDFNIKILNYFASYLKNYYFYLYFYFYFRFLFFFVATDNSSSSKTVHTGGSNATKITNNGVNGVNSNSNREREKEFNLSTGNNSDLSNTQHLNNNINNINNLNININKNQIALNNTHASTNMNINNNGNTLNLGVFGPDGLLLKKSRRSHGDGKYLYTLVCMYVCMYI